MAKVSASTLARRANNAKTLKEKMRLRAEAAKMRRDARKPRPMTGLKDRETIIAGVNGGTDDAAKAMNQTFFSKGLTALAASVDHMPLVSKPWYESEDTVANLMKAKNPQILKIQLDSIIASARHDARMKEIEDNIEATKSQNEAWRVAIVSAFIGQVETMERDRDGIPKTVVVSGLTIARITDALREAGYTSNGKTGAPRWRAVGR